MDQLVPSFVAAPIVLVHGVMGFSELRVGGVKIGEYFRGIRAALMADGNLVPEPPRLVLGGIEQRAQALRSYLDRELPGERVHLIAHSMGGLDCRYLISCLGMADRVLSLTTVGTPHHGTPLADHGVKPLRKLIDALFAHGIDLRGFIDLTTAACREFNGKAMDIPNVRYFSVAGEFESTLLDLLKLPYRFIRKSSGPNDGLVPVRSAEHGRFLGVWPCNHFRLVNWATNVLTPPGDFADTSVVERYRGLVSNLAAAGF